MQKGKPLGDSDSPFDLQLSVQLGCAVGVRRGRHVLRDRVQQRGASGGSHGDDGEGEDGVGLEAFLSRGVSL